MKNVSNLEQSFIANTCFYHPGLLIEAVCTEKNCSSNELLCCQCIKMAHHTHDLIPIQKYKKIAVQAAVQPKKLLAWRWEESEEKQRLKDKDKKLLIDFRSKMDAAWHKIQEALKIVDHAGDLKVVRKTLNTASDRLEEYVDGKLDSILERARNFKQNKVIELIDSEDSMEQEAQPVQEKKKSEEKKNKKRSETSRLDPEEILKEIQRQQQKISKERGQENSKKAKKEGKIAKEKQGERQISEIKKGQKKEKQERKRENNEQSSLKVVRNKNPQEENVEYFKIIHSTKERQMEQRRALPYLKIPEVYEVGESKEETEKLKEWYKETYQDEECRVFAHRFLKDKTKQYLIYFASEFNWLRVEALRGTDFESQLNQYERTISRKKDLGKK